MPGFAQEFSRDDIRLCEGSRAREGLTDRRTAKSAQVHLSMTHESTTTFEGEDSRPNTESLHHLKGRTPADYREADFRKTTQQLQHTTFFKLRSLYTLVFGKIVADPRAMWDGVKACRSLHSRLRPRRGASLGALLPVSPFTRNRIPPLRETGSDKQTNTPRRALFTDERSRTWFPKDLSLQSGAGNRRRTLIGTVKGLACRCSRLQGEVETQREREHNKD